MTYKKQIISKKTLIISITLFTCLYFLFNIKYSVNNLLYQKNELQKVIYKEKDNIRVLNAELCLLKNISRIKKIVNGLTITETNSNQIILNENDHKMININNIIESNKNWRYKKGKSKG